MSVLLRRVSVHVDDPQEATPTSPASEPFCGANLGHMVVQKRCPGCGVGPLANGEYPHVLPCWALAGASWWAHKRGETPRDHGIRIVDAKDLPE